MFADHQYTRTVQHRNMEFDVKFFKERKKAFFHIYSRRLFECRAASFLLIHFEKSHREK